VPLTISSKPLTPIPYLLVWCIIGGDVVSEMLSPPVCIPLSLTLLPLEPELSGYFTLQVHDNPSSCIKPGRRRLYLNYL
jgi:hypothetical protein